MRKVQKFVVLALLVILVHSALPAMAAQELPANLGQDHVKMTWWVLDYGTRADGTHFAVVRKFYTSPSEKEKTINDLSTKYGINAEMLAAPTGGLYGTEYGYEYTKDGKQFAVTYILHFRQSTDPAQFEIHRTDFDNSSDETTKTFYSVDPKQTVGKVLAMIRKSPRKQ